MTRGDKMDNCKIEIRKESSEQSSELAKAFTIGMALGFAKKYDEMGVIMKAIKALAPQPKMGRWISSEVKGEVDGQIVQAFTCSECGAISIFRMASGNIVNGDLCPNCGCCMNDPQESESKRYTEIAKSYVEGLRAGLAESEDKE